MHCIGISMDTFALNGKYYHTHSTGQDITLSMAFPIFEILECKSLWLLETFDKVSLIRSILRVNDCMIDELGIRSSLASTRFREFKENV